jgi:hypothetical protein
VLKEIVENSKIFVPHEGHEEINLANELTDVNRDILMKIIKKIRDNMKIKDVCN